MMSETLISLTVQMDEQVFRRFAFFDSLLLSRKWLTLAAFFAAMLILALVNLFTGAALLFWILLGIGLLTPAAFLVQFAQSVRAQALRFRLDKPKPVYRFVFSPGEAVFTLQITGQAAKTLRYAALYGAYRTRHALYVYTERTQAYIIPTSQLATEEVTRLWGLFVENAPAGRTCYYSFPRLR